MESGPLKVKSIIFNKWLPGFPDMCPDSGGSPGWIAIVPLDTSRARSAPSVDILAPITGRTPASIEHTGAAAMATDCPECAMPIKAWTGEGRGEERHTVGQPAERLE
jgi:hypothetical protein